MFDRFGKASVTILRLIANTGERFLIARGRHALVSSQALAHVVNVLVRNGHIDAEVDRYARFIFHRFPAQLRNGALEHLRVKIEAQRVHVARLLAAEQIAGAAQFEIQRSNAKAGAQV